MQGFFQKIGSVLVLASSSRGGSSFLAEILKRSPDLVHFTGEINPFLVKAGLVRPASDALSAEDACAARRKNLDALEAELSLDAGNPMGARNMDDADLVRFKADLGRRFSMQWPEISLTAGALSAKVDGVFEELRTTCGWKPGEFKEAALFHAFLLRNLRADFPRINPYYYDLDPLLLQRHFPGVRPAFEPPSAAIVEEPPFVAASPWRPASDDALRKRTLVIKTPSNAYRLPFLRALFPNARLRVLHLTRNPAASVNGLYDGWRHHGFFSRRVTRPLNIAGYTDFFPAWAKEWWKFDLPPGWEKWADAPLERVCGFQWSSAHNAVMDFIEKEKADAFRLRFEEAAGSGNLELQRIQELAEWLGIDGKPIAEAVKGTMAPVMATRKPAKRRWAARADLLEPVLSDADVRETARRLGYGMDRAQWL